jgi:hypothetical protein
VFELEDKSVERGPAGTVPVVRKDFSRIHATTSLRAYLAKGSATRLSGAAAKPVVDPVADPNPAGFFHAEASGDVTSFGAETVLNVWDPSLENSGDHSLMQLGIQNRKDLPKLQSLELGWEACNDQYGDSEPHFFIYYTTNGYTEDDDNVGGYNQDVDGWVQVDGSIFPAARITGLSTRGGEQRILPIKCQLYESNWWVKVMDTWIGYYPASLFMGNQSVFSTLGDHGDWAGFWGEVFSADNDPNVTITQMGSGSFGEAGFAQACFQSNLRTQSDRSGTMADAGGATSAENSSYYDIVANMSSGTSWGSYFYAGGPGADILWAPLGGQWPGDPSVAHNADGRLELFLRGNDTNLYHLWQTAPNNGWSEGWAPMGGQWPGDPALAQNADGRLEIFIRGNWPYLYHRWQTAPSNGWSEEWLAMRGSWHRPADVTQNQDGRLEIFIVGDDTNLYHAWQTAPSNGWALG